MADPRATYLTNIALIQQRATDRAITLNDLDPNRRNSRVAPLMVVERMKQTFQVQALSVDVETGTWIREDLSGTKPGTAFTISQTPELATLLIVHQNAFVTRVSGAALGGEYSISATAVTMGLTVNAGESLWALYRIA